MAFANTLLPTLSASDVIILVPLAYGGTGYSDGHWAVGGDLYLGAIARLSALKAYIVSAYPGAAIEWNFSGLSGEAETTSTHKAYLDSVTASFDGIIAGAGLSNVGFLLNRMSPSWVSTTVGGNAIDSAQVRLRERYARTWVMDSPDGPYDPGSSNIHFNADAQVARGHRKASKYAAMRARTTPFNQRTDWCDALSAGQYAAYSLWRRLANGYSGPLFKINTAATGGSGTDIGVDANGFVDLTAVAAAIGSADGYVEVLYDQSGNARHFSTTGSVNRPRIATAGQLTWFNGRPVCGVDSGTCGLLATYDVGSSGSIAWAGRFVNANNASLFASRGVQLFHGNTASAYSVTIHNPGTMNAGAAVATGVHVLLGQPTPRIWLDGVENTSLASITPGNSTFVGSTTLLHRQVTVGTASQPSNDKLSELIVAASAWSDADRAIIHAAMVDQYQPDAYA